MVASIPSGNIPLTAMNTTLISLKSRALIKMRISAKEEKNERSYIPSNYWNGENTYLRPDIASVGRHCSIYH